MSTTIRANKQIQGQLFDWRPTDVLKSPDVTSRLASGTPEGGPDVSGEVGGVKTEILRTPVAICDTQEKVVQRIALRPYQLDAGAAIDAEWARGIRATLLVLATGLGKTVVAADTIRRFLERADRPCLFLAHREELLEQTIRKLADVLLGKDPAHEHAALGEVRQRLFLAGYSTDLEQAEHRASLSARVVVASVQSLQRRRLTRFPSAHFGLVIVDEAHHAPAATYRNVLGHFGLAQVLGLTATPDRGDGKALGKIFQSVAYRLEIRAGIAAGFLAPIIAKKISVKSIDLRTIDKVAGDFHHGQLDAMMSEDRTVHGVVSPMLQEVGDRRTIVFCVSVAHAHRMAEVLRDSYGRTAVALDGTAEKDERREVLRAYSRGEFQFLLNCALFTEGFDSPGIQCVAVARPTLSRGLYVQMVGRGTRLIGLTIEESIRNGKPHLLLLDFVGNSRHKLVGPADALAGDESAELREQMEKLLGEGDGDVMQAAADAQAALERGTTKLVAVAAYRTSEIDPFLGDHAAPLNQTDMVLCSAQTLAALKQDLGIHKPPPNLTEGEARNWIRAHAKRKSVGLCSLKQCKALERAGIDPKALRKMTAARANELVTMLATHTPQWHPDALIGQPERIGAIR